MLTNTYEYLAIILRSLRLVANCIRKPIRHIFATIWRICREYIFLHSHGNSQQCETSVTECGLTTQDTLRWRGSNLSLPLFPFIRGEVLPETFSPPHLLFFSTILCLLSSSSSLPPLMSSSHLSLHSPPISVLASLVSSCPAHVTMPLSSVVFHRPSFLRVQPTVIGTSPVSLSSSIELPSLPLTPPFFACLLSLLLLFFRTQLFSHTCSCCSSFRASVSVPYRHAGVTQVPMTLPFSLFEIRRSAITPSTALHAFAPACTLRRTSLSPSFRLRTRLHLGTRNCPVDSVSFPPARCQALPSGGLCTALPLFSVQLQPAFDKQPVPLLHCIM